MITYSPTERIIWRKVGAVWKPVDVTVEKAVDLELNPECRSCINRVPAPNAKWCKDCAAAAARAYERERNEAAGIRCPDCDVPVSRLGLRCRKCGAKEAARKRSAKANVQCGTSQGYDRHRRHKEAACDPCKAAEAARTKAYREARYAA